MFRIVNVVAMDAVGASRFLSVLCRILQPRHFEGTALRPGGPSLAIQFRFVVRVVRVELKNSVHRIDQAIDRIVRI